MATDTVDIPVNAGVGEAAGFDVPRRPRTALGTERVNALQSLARKGEHHRILEMSEQAKGRRGIRESSGLIRGELRDTAAPRGTRGLRDYNRIDRSLLTHTGIIEEGLRGLDVLTPPERIGILDQLSHALETSAAGSGFQRIPGANRRRTAEEYLNDAHFLSAYREAAENAANRAADAQFNPTDEQITSRIDRIISERRTFTTDPPVGSPPGTPLVPSRLMTRFELRRQAYDELADGWEQRTADILGPRTVLRDAVENYTNWRLGQAEEASNVGLSRHLETAFTRLQTDWDANPANIRRDFAASLRGGGREILGPEVWNQMDEEQKEDFNTKLAEKILIRRLGVGKLSPAELDQMSSSDLLGKTAIERIDKIEEIFNAVMNLRTQREGGRVNDMVNRTMWQTIRRALPLSGGVAGSAAVALLIAALTAPLSVPAIIAGSVVAGGTGILAGGLRMTYDQHNDG